MSEVSLGMEISCSASDLVTCSLPLIRMSVAANAEELRNATAPMAATIKNTNTPAINVPDRLKRPANEPRPVKNVEPTPA